MQDGAAAQEAEEDEAHGSRRAMKVARVLAAKGGIEFAKPGKLVEVRFVKGQSLSLTASRLLALMILTAGGDAWREMPHRMRKADIRRGHRGNERIVDMLEELHCTLFAEDDLSWRGRKAIKRFSLIQSSREEIEEGGRETGWIEWEFTPDARRLIQDSETYAVLNRQAVLGFRSSYALKLYEMGALRVHRRQTTWRGDMSALRAALGIPPEVYKDFAQLRRRVLDTAKAEIDQLAHFTVEWREIRQGKAIAELEFCFAPKDAPAQIETVDELERHSGGRRVRRKGTAEVVSIADRRASASTAPGADSAAALIEPRSQRSGPASSAARVRAVPPTTGATAPLTFPAGSLRYFDGLDLLEIGRSHGGGWDVDLIAEAYRTQMGDRLAKLSGAKLKSSWQGFCESYAARRGRP